MKLQITSAYELLEKRLGLSGRITGSIIFIMTRLVWMALLIYLAAKAMVVMLDWPLSTVPYIIVMAGLVAILYTAMGGLRAVVITDVVQFFVLMAGAILTIVFITIKLKGVGQWWPTEWATNWDIQPFFNWDPRVRVTVVGALVNHTLWWVCTAGSDQVAIQRYLATRDTKSARRAFTLNIGADICLGLLLAVVGFALLGFFRTNPAALPQGKDLITDADFLFPLYIANFLPVGIAGLVIAGMFAAAMSSLDSGINSIVTVVSIDFLDRFRKKADTQQHTVSLAKYLVLCIGIMVVMLSILMNKVPGNLLEVTNKTNGLFVGPLFGLFVMALFIPFATSFGAIFGAIYGLAAAVLVAYWDVITGKPGLSFQWIIAVALVVNTIVGCLFSLLPMDRKKPVTLILYSIVAIALLTAIIFTLIHYKG